MLLLLLPLFHQQGRTQKIRNPQGTFRKPSRQPLLTTQSPDSTFLEPLYQPYSANLAEPSLTPCSGPSYRSLTNYEYYSLELPLKLHYSTLQNPIRITKASLSLSLYIYIYIKGSLNWGPFEGHSCKGVVPFFGPEQRP